MALLVTANISAISQPNELVTLHDDRFGCDIEVAQLVAHKSDPRIKVACQHQNN